MRNHLILFSIFLSMLPNVSPFLIQSEDAGDKAKDRCKTIECTEEEKERKSICGTNGSFYDSICDLKLDACNNGTNVTEETIEHCMKFLAKNSEDRKEDETVKIIVGMDEKKTADQESCPNVCLGIQDPVCGSDGQIYPNACLMNKRNCGKKIEQMEMKFCFARSRQGRKLSDDPCSVQCLETYRPVCGSDGNLYQNECFMKRDTCKAEFRVVPVPRSLCIATPRCPRNCLPIHDPTCGSDGKMYLNTCRMKADTCYGRKVKKMNMNFCIKNEE